MTSLSEYQLITDWLNCTLIGLFSTVVIIKITTRGDGIELTNLFDFFQWQAFFIVLPWISWNFIQKFWSRWIKKWWNLRKNIKDNPTTNQRLICWRGTLNDADYVAAAIFLLVTIWRHFGCFWTHWNNSRISCYCENNILLIRKKFVRDLFKIEYHTRWKLVRTSNKLNQAKYNLL